MGKMGLRYLSWCWDLEQQLLLQPVGWGRIPERIPRRTSIFIVEDGGGPSFTLTMPQFAHW